MSPPPFHVALVEPKVPQNAGNVGRLALAFGARLHLVGRLGFSIDEKACRRAGLDYWPHVDLATWDDLAALERGLPGSRLWLFSAHGQTSVAEAPFAPGDVLVFGNEATGLSPELVAAAGERSVRIPIRLASVDAPNTPVVRSLNLANAVSIGVYEAARRLGFPPVELSAEAARTLESAGAGQDGVREPGRPTPGARAAIKELQGAGLVENRRRRAGPRP